MTTDVQTSTSEDRLFSLGFSTALLAVSCMAVGLILFKGSQPHSTQWMWGKEILMPVGNFLLFVYLLFSKVIPMLKSHLQERHVTIASALESFEEQSGNIAERFQDITAKLANVDEETASIIAHAKEQAAKEKVVTAEQAEAAAGRILKSAEDLTNYERHRIHQRLRRRLIDSAFTRAEALLTEHINDEDQTRLQSDYLKLVDKIS